MKDWQEEVERLQNEKQNEERNKRLELVADEINELAELENEFTITGTELDQYKQALVEVIARTSPEITELTQSLKELKSAISEIDAEMYLQGVVIKNSSLEVARQQNLVNALAANKDNGDLEFASWMAGQQTLMELQRRLETEKAKLKNLTERFYRLNAVPDIATLDRRIRELKTQGLNAQTRVESIERDRREMNSRMNFLRATLAKNEAKVLV